MLDDGEIERRVRLIRPMESRTCLWQDDGRRPIGSKPTGTALPRPGRPRVAEVPEFTDSEIHIVAGLLLPIWKRLPNESTRVYRLQTDSGERIIGRKVSPAWVASALDDGASALTPDAAFTALMDGQDHPRSCRGPSASPRPRHGRLPDRTFRLYRRDARTAHRLRPLSARSSPGSCACSCRSMRPAQRPCQGAGALSARAYRRAGRRRDGVMMRQSWRTASAREAEAVCRHYLSRAAGSAATGWSATSRTRRAARCSCGWPATRTRQRPPGKWTDAATGEHGDLLDVIRETLGLVDFNDVAEEARRFLSLPRPEPERTTWSRDIQPAPSGSPEAARRLFAMSHPIHGTLVESYLRDRGITALHGLGALRFHPRCYYRPDEHSPTEIWPAMIAAVTDLDGRHHRRTPHLARPLRLLGGAAREGACRDAEALDGRAARARRPLRRRR
jgi:hypothetical protein